MGCRQEKSYWLYRLAEGKWVVTEQTKMHETSFMAKKKDADYVFFELTRSICPQCRRGIDAQIRAAGLSQLPATNRL